MTHKAKKRQAIKVLTGFKTCLAQTNRFYDGIYTRLGLSQFQSLKIRENYREFRDVGRRIFKLQIPEKVGRVAL